MLFLGYYGEGFFGIELGFQLFADCSNFICQAGGAQCGGNVGIWINNTLAFILTHSFALVLISAWIINVWHKYNYFGWNLIYFIAL